MEIKTQKSKSNFQLRLPKKSAFAIDTPDDIPRLHQLMIVSAKRGGGKLIQTVQFISELLDREIIDRVIIITPTYYSNKEGLEPLHINEETDVLEPTKENLAKVIDYIDQERKDYDDFIEKEKKYKQFNKLMVSRIMVNLIPPDQLIEYDQLGFFQERPKWKYKHIRPPRVFLIVDDSIGTELMNPKSGLLNLCIKHRHIGKGLGISIALLTQSYSCRDGLPRPIRENCTMLLLGKCKDENQIEKIHQEIGADINLDKFDMLYKYATDKPFGFLIIDFHPKDPIKMFRAGWNEFIS
jgi:hypothetical protein